MENEERVDNQNPKKGKPCPQCGAAMKADKIERWYAAYITCSQCGYRECIYMPPDDGGGPDGTWIA
jgi:predicted RNA-binding Zn-ribbon protein involved in translation (DUF1610 family)